MKRALILIASIHACFAGRLPAAGSSDGLLFSASYNSQDATAEIARGNPKSLNFTRTLQYLDASLPGVVKAGFQTLDNERCDYAMAGNFDLRQGTAGLWVRMENWRISDPAGYVFLAAEITNRYALRLQKPPNAATVELCLTLPGKAWKASCPAGRWLKEEWHKLDATWTTNRVAFYVDGEPASDIAAPLGGFPFPEAAADGCLSVNPNNAFGTPTSSPAHRTLVDEVRIHGRPLTAAEIKDAYVAAKTALAGGMVYRRPLVTAPLTSKPVTCDGVLGVEEWADAAKMPIMLWGCQARLSPVPASFMVKYDARKLYFGFQSAHPGPWLRVKTQRDDALWEDSAFEIALLAGTNAMNRRAYVALSAANVIYDMLDNNKAWNGARESGATVQEAEGWTAELSLAYEDLGVVPPLPGAVWKLNVIHSWDQLHLGYASWSLAYATEVNFHNVNNHGTLVFGTNGIAVRLASLGNLAAGDVQPLVERNRADAGVGLWTGFGLFTDGQPAKGIWTPLPPGGTAEGFVASAPLGRSSLLAVTVAAKPGAEPVFTYDTVVVPQAPLVLKYRCYPLRKQLDAELDLTNMDDTLRLALAEGRAECRLTFASATNAAAPLVRLSIKPATARSVWPLALPPGLPPGEYVLKADVAAGPGYSAARTVRIPDETFVRAAAEVNHEVPPPWSAITVTGDVVRVLNREYRLGASPFPVRMTALGQDVLPAPVDWVIVTTQGEERITWQPPRLAEQHADAVRFEGVGSLTRGGLSATASATVEFDGQWLVSVTLTPATPFDIQGMYLEYRMPRDCSEYVLAPLVQPWEKDRVLVDLFYGLNTPASPKHPLGMAWVTGMRSGLCFFTPTDGNWVYQPGQPNFRVVRRGNESVIRVLMISQPVTLRQPARYTIGLTATPAKPQPPRNVFFTTYDSWGDYVARTNWLMGTHDWIFQSGKWRDWISLVNLQPDALRRGLEEKRKKGSRYFWQYSCAGQLVSDGPYADYWGPTWAYSDQDPPPTGNFECCPNSSFRELIVYEAANLARDFGVGPYFDMACLNWCRSRAHGCGYVDSFGRVASTVPMVGYRDELKRIYKACHRHGCLLFNHNHSLWLQPAHSFSDIWLPGEQYSGQLSGRFETFYTQHVPLKDYRVEMNPFIHGTAMVFLPQYARAADMFGHTYNVVEWQSRDDLLWAPERLLAMLLPHDLAYANCNMPFRVGKRVLETLQRLGVYTIDGKGQPEAEFTGYWANPPVTPDDPDMLLSTYRVPGRDGLVAVLSNPTLTNRIVHLRIAASTGLPSSVRVKDEYPGTAEVPDGRSGIPIPAQSFRILTVAPAAR